jgi:hypothetical protein
MTEVLPLDRLAAGPEQFPLPPDQGVQRVAGQPAEVTVGEETPVVETEHPGQRTVPFDGHPVRHRVRDVRP